MLALNKLVLPVDFSERSVGAARYAGALAERYGSEIHMVHVIAPLHYDLSVPESSTPLLDLNVSRREVLGARLKRYLEGEVALPNAHRVLLEGDPAQRIVRYAHDEQAGLILLPTHGYGPFRRFILGSVTAKVLHDADCPVWTGVHLEEAPPAGRILFRTVLAALDLGAECRKSLQWAARFAADQGARLVIVHATPNIETQAGEYFDPDWKLHLKRQAAERITALQAEMDVQADQYIESGDVPAVLCDAASSLAAGLLVIGRGSASGVFGRLRANAYTIIRQSPCPVVSV